MKKIILVVVCVFFNVSLFSAPVGSPKSKIIRITSYAEYGNGDVIFFLENNNPEVDGYWINANDPGFEANLSMLYLALTTNREITVYYTDEVWHGSDTGKLYKIYNIILKP